MSSPCDQLTIDPEAPRFRVPGHEQREQLDQALGVQVLVRVAPIQVLVILGAVRPQDVQPLTAPADADLETSCYPATPIMV